MKTSQAYDGYHRKWLVYCKTFGVSSIEPSVGSTIAYAAWLATAGAWAERRPNFLGDAMTFSSVKQYVEHLTRALAAFHASNTLYVNPGHSLPLHWAMMAIKRKLGNAKQRARTVSLDELRIAVVSVSGSATFKAAFKFIALLAWLGAFRLGQLLPSGPRMLATTTQMDHLRLDADGRSLLVEIHRSKTNLFRERFRIIRIMGSSDVNLCIVRAFAAVRNATAFRRPKFLADLDVGLDSFAKFVGVLQDVIPARASTTHEKGVVSGHSPRRSFTKIAMERGVPLQSIMVFGDWGHEESVLSSYAVGAILPSIAIAPEPNDGLGLPESVIAATISVPMSASTLIPPSIEQRIARALHGPPPSAPTALTEATLLRVKAALERAKGPNIVSQF